MAESNVKIKVNVDKTDLENLADAMSSVNKKLETLTKNFNSDLTKFTKEIKVFQNTLNESFAVLEKGMNSSTKAAKAAKEETKEASKELVKYQKEVEKIKKSFNQEITPLTPSQKELKNLQTFRSINLKDPQSIVGIYSKASEEKINADYLKDKEAILAAYDETKPQETLDALKNLDVSKTEKLAASQVKFIEMQMAIEASQKLINGIKNILNSINNTFKTTLHISLNIKDNFNDILKYIGEYTSKTGIASYDVGTSIFTNVQARNMQLKYGITGSQSWALSQTMGTLGLSSDEDLLYMNATQRELFTSLMNKYSRWYDQLQSSGVLNNIQELQLEFQLFKQEFAVELLNWFGENKDVLLGAIKVIAEVLKWIATAVVNIASWLTGSKTVNNNISINQSNSATGVLTSQGDMQSFFQEQMQSIAKQISVSLN